MTTYAINTVTGGLSQYSGVYDEPRGIASLDGVLYVLTSTGLRKQDANGDEDVTARVATGNLSLRNGSPFNLFKVTSFMRSDSAVSVTLTASFQGNAKSVGPFVVRTTPHTELSEWRRHMGRGHWGYWYTVEIAACGVSECRYCEIFTTPIRRRG